MRGVPATENPLATEGGGTPTEARPARLGGVLIACEEQLDYFNRVSMACLKCFDLHSVCTRMGLNLCDLCARV
jgi:hypothetical protein